MNNLKLKIVSIFFALLFFGCEDFLEKYPTDQATSEIFWKSETDAKAALMGVYSNLYLEPFGTQFRLEVLTDNSGSFPALELEFNQITRGEVTPVTGGPVTSWYQNMYTGIASCNFFLDNIDNVKTIDGALKNQYVAEVKFLRAWFYFLLQQTYGGVIIYQTTPTVEGSKIEQSTSEEVVNFILKDLDDAIPNLPNSKYSGRIVKNTAYAFKAKVLLHTKKWKEAAEEANKVIASGLSSLYPSYRDLFLSGAQKSNPDEILFSTVYAHPNRWHRGGNDHLAYNPSTPRKELFNAYLCIDGLPTNESPLFNPENPSLNRDPRCLQTINPTNKRVVGGKEYTYSLQSTSSGMIWNKFVEDNMAYQQYNVDLDDYDIIHLRYADVLLMYAEAKNEESGPDQSVYDAINKVRARSKMPAVALGLSKNEMRETIRLERRIELAGEGHRWFDLKRWGIANEMLINVNEPGSGKGTLKMLPHQYIWPIPQTDIDLNPNLKQNPGYN